MEPEIHGSELQLNLKDFYVCKIWGRPKCPTCKEPEIRVAGVQSIWITNIQVASVENRSHPGPATHRDRSNPRFFSCQYTNLHPPVPAGARPGRPAGRRRRRGTRTMTSLEFAGAIIITKPTLLCPLLIKWQVEH